MFSQSLSSRGLIVSIYSLVFSQSLLSLDLIELYLEYWDTGLGKTGDKKEEKKDKKTSGDDDDHPVSHLPLSLPTPSLPPALLPPLPASIPLPLFLPPLFPAPSSLPDVAACGPQVAGQQGWVIGADYFRMDGSTSAQQRHNSSRSFNSEDNPR